MTSDLERIILEIGKKVMSQEEIMAPSPRSDIIILPPNFSSRQYGLLLTKMYEHLIAIRHADLSGNLHSLAVHARVVLECVGQITRDFDCIRSGKINERVTMVLACTADAGRRMIKYMPEEYRESYKRFVEDLANEIRKKFESESDFFQEMEERKHRLSDEVKYLENGKRWYDLISEHFIHGKIKNLKVHFSTKDLFLSDLIRKALLDYLIDQLTKLIGTLERARSCGLWYYGRGIELSEADIESKNEHGKELDTLCHYCIQGIRGLVDVHRKEKRLVTLTSDKNDESIYRMHKILLHAEMLCSFRNYGGSLHIIALECRVAMDQINQMVKSSRLRRYMEELSLFVHPVAILLGGTQRHVGGLKVSDDTIEEKRRIRMLLDFGISYAEALLPLVKKANKPLVAEIKNEFCNIMSQLERPGENTDH